jgi:hypothetical protein
VCIKNHPLVGDADVCLFVGLRIKPLNLGLAYFSKPIPHVSHHFNIDGSLNQYRNEVSMQCAMPGTKRRLAAIILRSSTACYATISKTDHQSIFSI